jgi:uridine kinase
MKMPPLLVAIVGGSGAGKSWLSQRLEESLRPRSTRLSLDNFYRDQSHLEPSRRKKINFDHPKAIDWKSAEKVLLACSAGQRIKVPRYSFVTHTRSKTLKVFRPRSVILVDGLWLLRRPPLRRMFALRIFLHCPASLRLDRRLVRDIANRGRDSQSVRKQFRRSVAPMHKRFVAPQVRWADVVLRRPPGQKEIDHLVRIIEDRFKNRGRSGFRIASPKAIYSRRPSLPKLQNRAPVPAPPGRDKGRGARSVRPCFPEGRGPTRRDHPSLPR